jgi:hypothetical protein
MTKVNAERINRFIPGLITNSKLISAATGKSNDMLARGYFAHIDPDGNYVWPRIEATGYAPYLTLGENLAMDFTDAGSVVDAWMNSPTHRANIINSKFQDQGLASIYGSFQPGHDTIMVVSLFGTLVKKISATPPPPPATKSVPKKQTPPIAKTTPTPTPAPPATKPVATKPQPLIIGSDIKLTKRTAGDQVILEMDVTVAGHPKTVTAQALDKTISLLPSAVSGQYLGVMTFPKDANFADQKLKIQAVDESKASQILEFDLAKLPDLSSSDSGISGNGMPVSSEAQFLKVLKIIFGIFAGIFMLVLGTDSIIIHRAKIKRQGISSSQHFLLFFLIAAVSLLSMWF